MFVHEFGHFIAAKKAGVFVETFSLGMGPKLVKKKIGDTEYCISAVPLGGYVKMKGENPDEESSGSPDELTAKSIPARFSIFVAGPLMNALFAILLLTAAFYIGLSMPKDFGKSPVVGVLDENSPAYASGLRTGDVIRSVDGESVDVWEQVLLLIASARGDTVEMKIGRDDLSKTITIPIKGVEDIGIRSIIRPIVGGVQVGFPAEKAGLQAGDEIVIINGNRISYWDQLVDIVSTNPNKELQVTILREGLEIEKLITPTLHEDRGYLGISAQRFMVLEKYGLGKSFLRSIEYSWELTQMTVVFLRRLVTLKASAKTVGGPIMIAQLSGQMVRQGPSRFLEFMSAISLSLAIFNLLPIPVLDGGHIFLLGVEFLHRKPLSMKKRELVQKIGLLILIPLFLFVFYNDIARWLEW